jgi:hypothetical protein
MGRQVLIRWRGQGPLLTIVLNSTGVPDRTFPLLALFLGLLSLMAATQFSNERLSRCLALFLFFF